MPHMNIEVSVLNFDIVCLIISSIIYDGNNEYTISTEWKSIFNLKSFKMAQKKIPNFPYYKFYLPS